MMRTSLLVLLAGMALGAGCSDDREAPSSVRISPTVSRVTGLYFDKEDRIGLTISRTSGDYVTNRLMTYDGSVFTASGLKWYESTQETSTLTAYYPYSEAGVPSAFSVEADQRQGCTPSDLLGAVAREVRPGSAPVAMVFYHLMSQLSVVVENNGSSPVAAVKIGGSVVEAVVDLAVPSAKAKAGAAAVQIEAFEAEPDSRYRAVLVPQQTTLDVEVELQDGSVCRKSVSDALLEGGRCYDLSVVISGGGTPQIEVSISGDVVDWVDGGELVGSDGGNDGTDGVDHEGEHYRTVAIDGKVWMAENMRHKPAGAQLGTGIWEPAGGASMISTQGMLYDYATATAGASDGAGRIRGICPEGWHIPDADELRALAESQNRPEDFFCCAGYQIVNDKSNRPGAKTMGKLMGIGLADDSEKCNSLDYTETTGPLPATISRKFGLSLRCVKD